MQGGTAFRYIWVKDAQTGKPITGVSVVAGGGTKVYPVDASGIAVISIPTTTAKIGQTITITPEGVKTKAGVVIPVANAPKVSVRVVAREMAILYKFGATGQGTAMSVGQASRDGLLLTVRDGSGGREKNARLHVGRHHASGAGASVGAGATCEFSGALDFGGNASVGAEAWALSTLRDVHAYTGAFDGNFTKQDAHMLLLVLDSMRRISTTPVPAVQMVENGLQTYLGTGSLPGQQRVLAGSTIETAVSGNCHLADIAITIGNTKYGLTMDVADAKLLSAIGVGGLREGPRFGSYCDGILSLNWNVLEGVQWQGEPIVPSEFRSAGQAAQSFCMEHLADSKNTNNSRLSLIVSDAGDKYASYRELICTADGQEAAKSLTQALDSFQKGTISNLTTLLRMAEKPGQQQAFRLGGQVIMQEVRLAMRAMATMENTPYRYQVIKNDRITTAEQTFAFSGEIGVDFGIDVGGKYARFKRYPVEEGVSFNGRIYPLATYSQDFLKGTGNGRSLAELAEDLTRGMGKVTSLSSALQQALSGTGVTASVTPTQGSGKIKVAGFDIADATYSITNGVTTGSGSVTATEVGALNLNFTLAANGTASGTWNGTVALPGLGVAASNGTITNTGLTGSRTVRLGATDVQVTYTITQNGVSGSWTGTIQYGGYAFNNTKLTLDHTGVTIKGSRAIGIANCPTINFGLTFADGVLGAAWKGNIGFGNFAMHNVEYYLNSQGGVTVSGTGSANIPGIGSRTFSYKYEGEQLFATSDGALSLGAYSFANASVTLSNTGNITVTGSNTFTIPGLDTIQFSLQYVNGTLSATGKRNTTLGSFAFGETTVTLARDGKISIDGKKSFNIPGFGSREYTLQYQNNALGASATGATIMLGGHAFSNSTVTLSSTGGVSASGSASLTFPGLGTRTFNLTYVNGVLQAETAKGVSLGSRVFSEGYAAISSTGQVSVSGKKSFTLTGLGNREYTLKYENNTLSATAGGDVTLGGYAFSNSSITMASDGKVSASGTMMLNIPGLGNREFTLQYENNTLSASASGGVTLGSYSFSEASINLSSTGVVSVSGYKSITIPGIGARDFSVSFNNGTLSATWSGTMAIAGVNRSVTFSLDGNGAMRWRSTTAIKVGDWTLWQANQQYDLPPAGINTNLNVLGKTITIVLKANGDVDGSYTGNTSVAGIPISSCTLTVSNTGVAGTGILGTGTRNVTSASFNVKSNGVVSGSGNVNLHGTLNVGVTFNFSGTTKSVSGSIDKDLVISGAMGNWHYVSTIKIGLASDNAITASTSGKVTRNPKHICHPLCPDRNGLNPCGNNGKETGQVQNFGQFSGSVNLGNGEIQISVPAKFTMPAQTLTFKLW
jgi:hypothetical protein